MDRPIRVLVAKPGLDGHDRGCKGNSQGPKGCWHGGYIYRS